MGWQDELEAKIKSLGDSDWYHVPIYHSAKGGFGKVEVTWLSLAVAPRIAHDLAECIGMCNAKEFAGVERGRLILETVARGSDAGILFLLLRCDRCNELWPQASEDDPPYPYFDFASVKESWRELPSLF
jgi:hypothetical protein